MKASHNQNSLCGPGCRYRGLYEGTQSGLADLAAKQAAALNRLGRIRQGLVLLLRATAPRRFGELERHLESRLSEVDDETLLSCAQWLMEPVRDEASLSELRSALAAAGFPPADNTSPAALLESVREHLAARVAPAPAALVVTPDVPAAVPSVVAPTPVTQHPGPTPPAAALATVPSGRSFSEARQARQAAAPETAHPASQMLVPGAHPAGTDPALVGLFDDELVPLSERSNSGGAVSETPAEAAALAVVADDSERAVIAAAGDAAVRADLTAAPQVSDPSAVLDAIADAVAPDQRGTVSPSGQLAGDRAASETSDGSAVAATTTAAPARPSRTVRTGPAVRPELFPTATAGRAPGLPASRRRPRVSATAPSTLDVPTSPTVATRPADSAIEARLAAAVAIPRPVFISDLVDLVGSAEEVEAWMERCRADGDSPFRFIPPKSRHRLRGCLVIPVGYLRDAAAEFSQSWWAECLERFHGAKLYEMAVLLHAIGDQVRSWKVNSEGTAVLMRVAQQRGIVGIVVLLDDRLGSGEPGRGSLTSFVGELLRDRLDLLVVLTTTDPMLQPAIAALSEEAATLHWKPSCHVVAARSWEWASGNAAAALHVLG
jgi:hypothetical protein